MCSFDVRILFTNVPVEETINICAGALFDNPDSKLYFSKGVFVRTNVHIVRCHQHG